MARNRTSPPPPLRSFEPEDPTYRVLNRLKGEGRRRLLLGLQLAGTPLEALPDILVRENLTAAEYEALREAFALELDGELLPDLLPGELEAARVTLTLPGDRRTVSLRARPHSGGAALRLVDDRRSAFRLSQTYTPWPPTVRDVARLLDESRDLREPYGPRLLRSTWREAKELGHEDGTARRAVGTTAIFLGDAFHRGLVEVVDALFEAHRAGKAPGDGREGAADCEGTVQ